MLLLAAGSVKYAGKYSCINTFMYGIYLCMFIRLLNGRTTIVIQNCAPLMHS